ncbi:hypothetical protein IE53DRAFT_97916 [Violaceomyces palustris]|uniref:Uncharacterized protein n=1 Tax=Violaceomyces palustris TaxID=1673888 RepID=A0ACD0NX25_9BASI|nr:hypothetical protein IE53DRAFT_97916 [Violaceomyces palustris]
MAWPEWWLRSFPVKNSKKKKKKKEKKQRREVKGREGKGREGKEGIGTPGVVHTSGSRIKRKGKREDRIRSKAKKHEPVPRLPKPTHTHTKPTTPKKKQAPSQSPPTRTRIDPSKARWEGEKLELGAKETVTETGTERDKQERAESGGAFTRPPPPYISTSTWTPTTWWKPKNERKKGTAGRQALGLREGQERSDSHRTTNDSTIFYKCGSVPCPPPRSLSFPSRKTLG